MINSLHNASPPSFIGYLLFFISYYITFFSYYILYDSFSNKSCVDAQQHGTEIAQLSSIIRTQYLTRFGPSSVLIYINQFIITTTRK